MTDIGRLVVLDLDGTVAAGDAPVLAYLRGLAGPEADTMIARWLADPSGYRDGYAFVAAWSAEHGVSDARRAAAYAESRRALHDGELAVAAPEGLVALLARRPAAVGCVLVTNAPVAGMEPLLDRLGIGDLLDGLIGDAGKPDGMAAILRSLLADADVPPARLLSVGDVWANDLAPAAALGAATAYVDRFARGDGAPTFRGPSLTALLADIEGWWAT